MNLKSKIKKIQFLYTINAYWKAKQTKRNYATIKKYYEVLSAERKIIYQENNIPNQLADSFSERNIKIRPLPKGNLRIIYVGTDEGQDFGGIIQGLRKFGEVIAFDQKSGLYGQMLFDKKGVDVAQINGKRLMAIVHDNINSYPLHVVIGQMWGGTMDSSILQAVRNMGIPVVNISMDDRHAFRLRKVDGKWMGTSGLIGAVDIVCTTAKECCLWYQTEGCPAIYLPEASDPELYKPGTVTKEYDVCFVGANYGIRRKIVKAIEKKGIRVTSYGNGWPNGRIDVKILPEIFSKSRVVLGVGTIGHCTDFYSLKMRDFDGPMSGSFYLTHDNPDLYELYDIGKEIVTYRNPEECVNKVEYYLTHPDERETIAKAGKEKAIKNHTWEKRFDKVLRVVGIIK